MTQSELNQAVSQATGDDVCDVSRLGFNLVDPTQDDLDLEPEQFAPQVYDWDAPFSGTTQPFYQSL